MFVCVQCSSDGEGGGRADAQLRAEIAHLREARDVLIVCRQRLNRRIHRVGVELPYWVFGCEKVAHERSVFR